MPIIKVTDGNQYQFIYPISIMDIAKSISLKTAYFCVAGTINTKLVDASEMVCDDSEISIITLQDIESINIIRQSCAHILGCSIKTLWPNTKIAISKTIENGFYCDIDLDHKLKNQDLNKIEKTMHILIIKKKLRKNHNKNIYMKLVFGHYFSEYNHESCGEKEKLKNSFRSVSIFNYMGAR